MAESPGFGRIPFAQSAATLPGVSEPSSVVRSMQRIARSRAHSFEDFLIERLASEAARSSAPTSSTLRTPRISEPRCVRGRAVATRGIMRRARAAPGGGPLLSLLCTHMGLYEDSLAAFRSGATGQAEELALVLLSQARDGSDVAGE